jgi:hypothetical protein
MNNRVDTIEYMLSGKLVLIHREMDNSIRVYKLTPERQSRLWRAYRSLEIVRDKYYPGELVRIIR